MSGVVEFGIRIGEYEGIVRVPREGFRRLIDGAVTPEKCVEAYLRSVPADARGRQISPLHRRY